MRFEWDDEKAVANLEKHGVSFGEATEVFYDPNALEGYDLEPSANEDRFSSSACRAADFFSLCMPSGHGM